jgi:hypothetical protein
MSQTPSDPPGPEGPGGEQSPTDPPAESWTPPGTPARTGTGSTKAGLLVILALVIVAVVGSVIYLITDDDKGSGNSPEGAVKAFYAAGQKLDCEKMADLLTEDSLGYMTTDFDPSDPNAGDVSRSQATADCEKQIAGQEDFVRGGTVTSTKTISEDGDTATVEITAEADGEESSQEVPLDKEDGRWRIDLRQLLGEEQAD